jgi:hypothetical protein
MKIVFPTNIRASYSKNFTFVTLNKVIIGFYGNTLMYVEDKKADVSWIYEGLNTSYRPYRNSKEVDCSTLIFIMNKLLYDQAEEVVSDAVDKIITNSKEKY